MSLQLSAFFTFETVVCFLSHSSPLNKDFYNPNGKAVWRKVCTFLLLAILLGKINYKACFSDPVWILKLLQKQFPPRGDQEEVKGLPIKQINIAGKGQNLERHCDTSPLQSNSFSFTCAKWPHVSADFGYQSLWKPLERDPPGFAPPVHGLIIDLTLIRFAEVYVTCPHIKVTSFLFGNTLSFHLQTSCASCQHHLRRESKWMRRK